MNEVFASIQGEGLFTGARTTFVRFAGCSVKCSWCDTKYAWGEGKDMTPRDVIRLVGDLDPKIVCLTGGEPFEQPEAELNQLVDLLVDHDFKVHVETSGTVHLKESEVLENIEFWSISPKLTNANPAVKLDIIKLTNMLQEINDTGINLGQFKFVIDTEDDMADVRDLVIKTYGCAMNWPIILQPCARGELCTTTMTTSSLPPHVSIGDTIYITTGTPEVKILAPPTSGYDLYFNKLEQLIGWGKKWLYDYDVRVMPQLHYLIWHGKKGI